MLFYHATTFLPRKLTVSARRDFWEDRRISLYRVNEGRTDDNHIMEIYVAYLLHWWWRLGVIKGRRMRSMIVSTSPWQPLFNFLSVVVVSILTWSIKRIDLQHKKGKPRIRIVANRISINKRRSSSSSGFERWVTSFNFLASWHRYDTGWGSKNFFNLRKNAV